MINKVNIQSLIEQITYNFSILTEKRAKEHLVFLQVIALMDYYNQLDEFIPNWNNNNEKVSEGPARCHTHHLVDHGFNWYCYRECGIESGALLLGI